MPGPLEIQHLHNRLHESDLSVMAAPNARVRFSKEVDDFVPSSPPLVRVSLAPGTALTANNDARSRMPVVTFSRPPKTYL